MEQKEGETDNEFKMRVQGYTKTLAEGIKISNALPVGSARTNFITCFPSFKDEIKPHSDRVLHMISNILKAEGCKTSIENRDSEEKIDFVVDGINTILDRVKDNLNILNGIKLPSQSSKELKITDKSGHGSWNKDLKRSLRWKEPETEAQNASASLVQKVVEKPQTKFKDKVDNSKKPFKPRIDHKPNSVKPLSVYLETTLDGEEKFCHPYMHELNVFKVPSAQLEKVECISPKPIDSTHCVYVDEAQKLSKMVESLKKEKELAVDLEHHNYRSYQGFTCLMQISTRETDYIIDTLALRHELHALNVVFTNPNIVKVFHGAESDIVWLQKDLNLYVVNLFDTHLAAVSLHFPRLNLAFLLKHFCGVESDKRYQLYDWRIRPLSEAALTYAKSDTHYLLYIYDKLRNELLEKANGQTTLLEHVYSRGADLCKKRYEKIFDDKGYLTLYKQSKQTFDNRQMHALESLYHWRDTIAREVDESTGYVLPNHMLLHIAEILPREMQGILGCCNPVPVLVRKNLSHIHQLIVKSRSQLLIKSISENDSHSLQIRNTTLLSKLGCPHDFSYQDDFRDNLATLLDGTDTIDVSSLELKACVSVFENKSHQDEEELVRKATVKFISPYERYKRTVEFALAEMEKQKENEKVDEEEEEEEEEEEKKQISKPVKVESEDVDERIPLKEEPEVTVIEAKSSPSKPPVTTKRKQKSLLEQVPNKKAMRSYDTVVDITAENESNPSSEVEKENSTAEEETSSSIELTTPQTDEEQSAPGVSQKKKNKKKNKKEKQQNNTNTFTAHDYSQTNWEKFLGAGRKNVQKLLNSKITFGSNKKGGKFKGKKRNNRF